MRCEVVAIGTELLLGVIVDSNSSWIGEQLALAGIDSHFQVKVGDNFARIESCIRQALGRCLNSAGIIAQGRAHIFLSNTRRLQRTERLLKLGFIAG